MGRYAGLRGGRRSDLQTNFYQPPRRSDKTEQAFAALVDRHARFLYRVAYSLLGHRQDAEDTVQDTLMKLYRTNAWQSPMNDERAYLARAVWRCGLDRRATAESRAMRHAEDAAEMPLVAAGLSPEGEALAASDRALLHRLVAALPDDLRQPLLLSAIEEMSGAEVAATLGVPEATVRTRLHRARGELRRRFLATTAAAQEVAG